MHRIDEKYHSLVVVVVVLVVETVVVVVVQKWAILSVSLTNTLASDTKYRYRWISSIDTNIGIAASQTLILVSVSLV